MMRTLQRPRGRPREFDEDEALDQALNVFWSQGFDATSLDDILDATGMARQSLYRVFGCKRALFVRALESYGAARRRDLDELLVRNSDPLAGLHALLDLWEEDACAADFLGCFNLNTLSEFAAKDDEEICDLVRRNLLVLEDAVETALSRAETSGALTLRRSPTEVAHSFVGAAIALGHLGRCEVPPELVKNIAAGIRAELET